MKAWELHQGKLELRDVEPPRAPGADETVVQISHAGFCGSDLSKLLRPTDFALPEPWRPGHEIVGTDPAGRPVAVDPLVPCADCTRCRAGDTHLYPQLRRLGWDLPGGFAKQMAVPATNAHPLPDGLDLLHAALADPAAVAIHGLRCSPPCAPGRLAVVGAGTVGLLTALYALHQAWEVTVVHRDGRAPHDTVTTSVHATFHPPSALPNEETFDVVVDAATGADPTPLDLALRLVRDGGTVIVQNAYHPGVHLPTPLRDLFRRSIHLIGAFSHCRRQRPDDFTLALTFLRDHATAITKLIADAGQLADLPTVISDWPTPSVRQVLATYTS
ncbi:MAG: zinc-dependent alcohol dehydrogenase [Pseudonocardia sp.]